ncbi:zf-CCCH domain-containing protein/Ank_2 domain-containing protein [Cephalotus follicularis]|uniref:Zf-CCCH domain-containing protein/Ank_2 domain-containing protein n=1 Tax=Cephalotus follicularis TaxID=3775 RepID=A0A1Q3BAA2_CEPFO|nr:zf-CCCH domain-containing protein/Ank_2 domain-containing protein [Cephalotus follicularis]
MESESLDLDGGLLCKGSVLLELSALNDLAAFKGKIEAKGCDVDKVRFWYGRRIGSKKMGYEERTPLMIAAMFGSVEIIKYIVGSGKVDVNRACGTDRVTALHCAVAGGASSSIEVVKLLLEASADANCVDANGNKPGDLLDSTFKLPYDSRKKVIKLLLKGDNQQEEGTEIAMPQLREKKEYPIDISMHDINNGVYSTDEFRMYSFKVKPCSRAYSHDWTECPFVHPGENARRRDPRKYPYSCVPCPEFRKGACPKGDTCEYAHGVFESWLHPAQYRTRLCKDEIGCSRKVCFFAHKPEELRPVYASTGSAMPSPRSMSVSGVDMATMSPLPTSTPPMSPLAASSSPNSGSLWNKVGLTPPALQLPGSRLKTAYSARDLNLEMELLGLDNQNSQLHRQQLMDEISSLSSPSCWNKDFSRIGDSKPNNLDDIFGSLDPSVFSPLHGLSFKPATSTQLHSPTVHQICQNMNQLRTSYPTNLPSSPARKPSSFGFESSAAVAAAVMNSRSSAFAKRSQSFIDRGPVTSHPGLAPTVNPASMMSSNLSGWSSPDGKLDWGIQGDDLNKLRKSASFGFRSNNLPSVKATDFTPSNAEGDASWVNSLVEDVSPVGNGLYGAEKRQYNIGKGVHEVYPHWMEQCYIEQEQMVA